jgi:hypothetical protein
MTASEGRSNEGTSRAARAEMPVSIQARAERLKNSGGFMAGRAADYESVGRMQLATLIQLGLYPSSKLLDVGCGSLRAGYWFMNFLEPGCYFGIEPRREEVDDGLRYIIEPELVEYARPTFAYNDDFNLDVFGTTFDFVIARSIWSHTTKGQIEAMLDSFLQVSHPGSLLVASYLPASPLPDPIREPLYAGMRKIPKLVTTLRRVRGRRLAPGDYQGDEWAAALVGHRRKWLHDQCSRRDLGLTELAEYRWGSQVWARIEHL